MNRTQRVALHVAATARNLCFALNGMDREDGDSRFATQSPGMPYYHAAETAKTALTLAFGAAVADTLIEASYDYDGDVTVDDLVNHLPAPIVASMLREEIERAGGATTTKFTSPPFSKGDPCAFTCGPNDACWYGGVTVTDDGVMLTTGGVEHTLPRRRLAHVAATILHMIK